MLTGVPHLSGNGFKLLSAAPYSSGLRSGGQNGRNFQAGSPCCCGPSSAETMSTTSPPCRGFSTAVHRNTCIASAMPGWTVRRQRDSLFRRSIPQEGFPRSLRIVKTPISLFSAVMPDSCHPDAVSCCLIGKNIVPLWWL